MSQKKASQPMDIPQQDSPGKSEPVLDNSKKPTDKKSKPLIVALIIILIIALASLGYFVYSNFLKEEPIQQSTNQESIEKQDADGDGLTTLEELEIGTSPEEYDSDFDGLPDGWEIKNNLDPKNHLDATQDTDEDKLNNLEEFQYKTDPQNPDTDSDTFKDGGEIKKGFDPLGKGKLKK